MVNPKDYRPEFLKKALGESDTTTRICLKCPTKLCAGLKYYCSGMCMNAAKMDGTYGNELPTLKE